MRTDIMIDILKNTPMNRYDHMSSSSNRICKGKCYLYKAKKPASGSRYAIGQVRCQTCEIYLIPQGVKDNRFCKCCNFRVRTKPRNSLYKEKYHEKLKGLEKIVISQKSTEEDLILEEPTKELIQQNSDNKKHTPIYEETDNSLKTYYEFKEFLDSTMKLQSNHQLVMLKELLEHGPLHKGKISESLAYFNNKDSSNIDVVKSFFNVPAYDVLLKYEIILVNKTKKYPQIPRYSLNTKFTDNERFAMLEELDKLLVRYNQENGISDNEFPNADNMNNIFWDTFERNLVINYKQNNIEDES